MNSVAMPCPMAVGSRVVDAGIEIFTTGSADAALADAAEPARLKFLAQPVSRVAVCFGFADFAAFLAGTVVHAIRGGLTVFVDNFPLHWRGVPRRRNGRRCQNQQDRRDEGGFHGF